LVWKTASSSGITDDDIGILFYLLFSGTHTAHTLSSDMEAFLEGMHKHTREPAHLSAFLILPEMKFTKVISRYETLGFCHLTSFFSHQILD
jgi:hypothetical protein